MQEDRNQKEQEVKERATHLIKMMNEAVDERRWKWAWELAAEAGYRKVFCLGWVRRDESNYLLGILERIEAGEPVAELKMVPGRKRPLVIEPKRGRSRTPKLPIEQLHQQMVEMVRADHIVGRGTCSVIDECYSDQELVEKLVEMGALTPKGALIRARQIHRTWKAVADDIMATAF